MTNLKHSAHAPLDRQAESSALNPESRNAGSDSRNAGTLARIEQHVDSAADTFDQIERIATAVITRTDRGKSLWTAVTGTLFQTAWAVFSFAAGLPREVWFFAAGVAAALTLMYLYRQITLGRIRERRNAGTLPASFSKD
jgi:Flp pilus assembly protein TadB